MNTRIFGLVLGFCLVWQNAIQADVVTLMPVDGYPGGGHVNALAGPLFSSDIGTATISGPGTGSASAALGGNFATHDYSVELDFSVGPAFFESMYHAPFLRTSTLDHRASAESIFFFTVDVTTLYAVEGFFFVDDELATSIPGNVELEIELLEFDSFEPFAPPPETVFYSWQVSKSTIDQGFIVGAEDGDTTNSLSGDISGFLDPSKFYRYRTLVTTVAIDVDGSGPFPPTDGMASAEGAHVITFMAATVPEPGSFLLLLVGGCLVMQRRSRKRILG